MPIDVTTTGSGSLGNINPGWSVQEFATPASPAERAGGTGMVSLSGGTQDESVLLINNASTITEPNLGDVSGVIRSVSESGLTATLTQDTKLARFDAVRQIPPMQAGSVPGALDLADQLTGTVRLAGAGGDDSGALWTFAGHSAGFDAQGDLVPFESRQVAFEYYDPAITEFVTDTAATFENALYADTFTSLSSGIYAVNVIGDSLTGASITPAMAPGVIITWADGNPKIRIFAKTLLNSEDLFFSVEGYPSGGSGNDRFQDIGMQLDYSAGTLEVFATYRSGGAIVSVDDTVDISSLDLDAELCIGIDFRYQFSQIPGVDSRYVMTAAVCNTSDYSTSLQAQIDWTPDLDSIYFSQWNLTGNFRDVWYRGNNGGAAPENTLPGIAFAEYVNAAKVSARTAPTLGTPVIGFDGNVWEWLQNACTVYRWEIGLRDDEVFARPMGGRALDIDNYSPSPAVSAVTTFTGRQVDVEYTNAQNVNEGLVYDAREDDNRIISVGAAQTTVTAVQTNAYLVSVLSPVRTTTFIPASGTYFVVDSTGLPIVADQWEDYGGSVDVSLDPEVVGGVVITVTGPTEEIPSTTAPYSLAVSDGENQYAALSFLGSGVLADPKTLELLTGADPDKTPTQVATTVSNPFIATKTQAFDTGVWATVDASGPRMSFSLTVPSRALQGFGVTPGSLVNWKNSTYRVTDSTITNLTASLNCVRHVTVADFDAVWAGYSVGGHDLLWGDYLTEDQKVLPLKALALVPAEDGFGLDPFGITPFGE